jgi:hypothetical protein
MHPIRRTPHAMTRRWKKRPEGSNRGECGDDDQVGRMNLPTAPPLRLPGAARSPVTSVATV